MEFFEFSKKKKKKKKRHEDYLMYVTGVNDQCENTVTCLKA